MDDERGDVAAVMAQVRAEAAAAGVSIGRLAVLASVTRSSLDLYLKGKRQMPMDVLYRIAAVVGVGPATILDRAAQRQRDAGQGA
jgi:transcriptional regulator with XRE-family HTH domain